MKRLLVIHTDNNTFLLALEPSFPGLISVPLIVGYVAARAYRVPKRLQCTLISDWNKCMSCNILGELSFIALKTGVTEPLLTIGTYFCHFWGICWPFLCFLLIIYWFVFEFLFLIELQPKTNFLWNLLKVCLNQIFMAFATQYKSINSNF